MFARIATFEGANEEEMQRLAEERMASGDMTLPAGARDAMVLTGPESGGRMFITFFDTRDDVDAAERAFDEMGDTIPEDIRGRRTSVKVYEVTMSSMGSLT